MTRRERTALMNAARMDAAQAMLQVTITAAKRDRLAEAGADLCLTQFRASEVEAQLAIAREAIARFERAVLS